MTTSTDRIKEKVRKLLNQAADREGTPEGDVFYARAFELMATYGFEQRDVENPDTGDETTHTEVEFTGAYTDMQAALLLTVASALHCTGFHHKVRRSTRVASATLFGSRRHLGRAEMLYTLLSPVMVAGASAQRSTGWPDAATVVKRRSYMLGFIQSVGARLDEAEDTVADTDQSYALALIDDRERAEMAQDAYVEEHGLHFTSSRRRMSFDGHAFGAGQDAGDVTDLGQQRVQARPALPF